MATEKTIYSRLADVGEEAIQRLGSAPGGDRVLGAVNSLRERVDDMQKNVRAIPGIEKRLTAIERRLDKLEGKSTTPPARKKTTPSSSSHKKTTT
jgi:RNA processing factor Prp31